MWGSDRRTSQRSTPQGTTTPSGAGAGAWGVPARPDALGAHSVDGARARGEPRQAHDARDPFGDAPDLDDALDAAELEGADADADADAEDLEAELIRADSRGGGGASATDPLWLRLQARKLLREFLRAVPRSEPQATISFVHPDGSARTVTRGQLATAIDRMRPRLRQIMRLSVEERWTRQRVCEYLRNISIKTFERDQAEGLDALIDGEFQGY